MSYKALFKLLVLSLFFSYGYVKCMEQGSSSEEEQTTTFNQEENTLNDKDENKINNLTQDIQQQVPNTTVFIKHEGFKGIKFLVYQNQRIIMAFLVFLGAIVLYYVCPEFQQLFDNIFKRLNFTVVNQQPDGEQNFTCDGDGICHKSNL